jgi:hypothetical protein
MNEEDDLGGQTSVLTILVCTYIKKGQSLTIASLYSLANSHEQRQNMTAIEGILESIL